MVEPQKAVTRAIFVVALVIATGGTTPAVLPDQLVFERLGRERGFPSETVTAVYRDRMGFLWVGSREGLAVWDGYEVRVFQHSVNDPSSLADDAVRRIYEDRSGALWVGLDAGGLQRLDRAKSRFESYRHDPSDPHSLSHDAVYAIVEGEDGILWVGTQSGLDRMDTASGKFEHLVADEQDPSSLPHPWVYDLHRDRDGRIWAATVGGGIAWVDPVTLRVTRVPFGFSSGATPRSELTFAIEEDLHGSLWFAAEDGVFRYVEETGSLDRATIPELRPGADTAIVTSIAFDRSGKLWASTWNEGLVGFDVATGASRSYRHDPNRQAGLATDRLSDIIADFAGDVWIGTWGRGMQRFNSTTGVFSRILERPGVPGGLPRGEVTSVYEDGSKRLWIGTWGAGVCRRDGPEGSISSIAKRTEVPGELATPLALAEDRDGSVWVGSMAGLYQLDREGEVEQAYRHDSARPDGIGRGYVNALAFDRDGFLWIGTGGSGLYRLDPEHETFVRYRHDPLDPDSLSEDHVTSLLFRGDESLWIGTRAGGLNRLEVASGRFERFLPDPDDPRSLPHHTVTSILEDHRGRTWVGTAGGGLARIESAAGGGWHVTRVGVADGLVNNSVVSIREDDDGSLWIGTRRGLSRYDPDTGRFHNYGQGDGLPNLEFRPNASTTGSTHLHFGTLGGVLSIARGSRFVPPAPTPTRITSIRTLDGPWPGDRPPWETRELEAPYGTMLSFEFGVLDLRPPHRYAYRLEGETEAWVDLGSRRELTFASLPPGRYALSVRGLNARGAWSESESPLRIRIPPPFWMSWWFRAVAAIAVVAMTWAWIHVRLNALARRNRELEALHRDRETALARAQASEESLQSAYERLRGLTRRLEDAKEEERRRIARELHDEMGQALSAIKINLKALGRSSVDPSAIERVGDALTLVDGIIRDVRALSLDLRPPLLDELGLVAALQGYAESQAERFGIDIAVEANAAGGDIPAVFAITAFRVAQESIHNVLRHAGAEHVTISVRRDPGRLSLAVRDDGAGFDVAEALDRAATGRHLGLLGMRERIEALGGSFEVRSEPGHGTMVHAEIPLGESEVTP